jgi:hypothetical protein
MQRKIKHRLPAFSVLEHLSPSVETLRGLQNCVQLLNDQFVSVFEINKSLCSIHHGLASKVYDNFFQIALTDSVASSAPNSPTCEEESEKMKSRSATESLRLRKEISTSENSPFNERSYTKKTEIYRQYQSLFDQVTAAAKGRPTRIRLVRLAAGTTVPPHIDYDPSYAVRIIIPIFSDPECLNLFWIKNQVQSVFLEPGKAYFLNTGYKHAVVNLSDKDRYTFMVTIEGSEDIDHLMAQN